ncbi:MAG: hypothetical protein GXX96_38835 [Planctomycetaceae bacterium]|nr:hypothetical protein [Planctomycetaceae bacterium]
MAATSPKSAVMPPEPRAIRVLLATSGWPSGLLDVGSWAARQPCVEVVILQIDGEEHGDFVEKLCRWRPHVVGFRVEGEPFEPILAWIQIVREVSDAEVVLGGPTATSHPSDLLVWSGADYVFAGEAEETFVQFLELAWRPNSRDLLPLIPGVAYRYGDFAFHNTLPSDGYGQSILDAGPTDCATSHSCLRNVVRPLASKEVLAANRLNWSMLEGFERPFDSLYFTGGRGCPGTCSFCARLHGAQVRIKSARQLLEEIEQADACVADGRLMVTRWPLLAHVDDNSLRSRQVSWAAVYDEDFFLNIPRALEFFELWSRSPLNERYRISLQTNPCSMLTRNGTGDHLAHPELLDWIDWVKPMVQLGAESFNPVLLNRWHKRHDLAQLNCVLDALDSTHQDYTVFQLLTDFETTPAELIETLRLLIQAAFAHPRMRIASSPLTIPLYDSDTRKCLEFSGRLPPPKKGSGLFVSGGSTGLSQEQRVLTPCSFRDYERPHPEWMDPLVADLADLADERLHWALNLETRDGALSEVMPAVIEHLRRLSRGDCVQCSELLAQAQAAGDEIAEARFQLRG